MAKVRAKFIPGHGKKIMTSGEMRRVLDSARERVVSNLAGADGEYGSIVEQGGDRLRAAVWTIDHRAKRETAADGTLLNALAPSGE